MEAAGDLVAVDQQSLDRQAGRDVLDRPTEQVATIDVRLGRAPPVMKTASSANPASSSSRRP